MSQHELSFTETDMTGGRLVVPLVKVLGHLGPKHHGLVIGKNDADGETYVTDFGKGFTGLLTLDEFVEKYGHGGEIKFVPNDGNRTNAQVAQAALDEILNGKLGDYDLVFNNCQNTVDRAMYGKPGLSSQVKNVLVGLGFALVGGFMVYNERNRNA